MPAVEVGYSLDDMLQWEDGGSCGSDSSPRRALDLEVPASNPGPDIHFLLHADHSMRCDRLQRRREEEEREKEEYEKKLAYRTVQVAPRFVADTAVKRLYGEAEKRRFKQDSQRQQQEHMEELQRKLSRPRLTERSVSPRFDGGAQDQQQQQPAWERLYSKASLKDAWIEREQHRALEDERRQLEEASVHRASVVNAWGAEEYDDDMPRHERLYLDGRQRNDRLKQIKQMEEEEERKRLLNTSVHRRISREVTAEDAIHHAHEMYADAQRKSERLQKQRLQEKREEQQLATRPLRQSKSLTNSRSARESLYEDGDRRSERMAGLRAAKEAEEERVRQQQSVHAAAKKRQWSSRSISLLCDRLHRTGRGQSVAGGMLIPKSSEEQKPVVALIAQDPFDGGSIPGGAMCKAARFPWQRLEAKEEKVKAKIIPMTDSYIIMLQNRLHAKLFAPADGLEDKQIAQQRVHEQIKKQLALLHDCCGLSHLAIKVEHQNYKGIKMGFEDGMYLRSVRYALEIQDGDLPDKHLMQLAEVIDPLCSKNGYIDFPKFVEFAGLDGGLEVIECDPDDDLESLPESEEEPDAFHPDSNKQKTKGQQLSVDKTAQKEFKAAKAETKMLDYVRDHVFETMENKSIQLKDIFNLIDKERLGVVKSADAKKIFSAWIVRQNSDVEMKAAEAFCAHSFKGFLNDGDLTFKEFNFALGELFDQWKRKREPPRPRTPKRRQPFQKPKEKKPANIDPNRVAAMLATGTKMWGTHGVATTSMGADDDLI
jgi:hypothetical protein